MLGLVVFVTMGVVITVLNEAWRRSTMTAFESQQRLAVTLISIGDGVITTDADGRITRAHESCRAESRSRLEQARGSRSGSPRTTGRSTTASAPTATPCRIEVLAQCVREALDELVDSASDNRLRAPRGRRKPVVKPDPVIPRLVIRALAKDPAAPHEHPRLRARDPHRPGAVHRGGWHRTDTGARPRGHRWLRAAWPEADQEEWEYAALMAAADASLGLLTEEDVPRRVVVVAEVDDFVEDSESTVVSVDSAIPERVIQAIQADTPTSIRRCRSPSATSVGSAYRRSRTCWLIRNPRLIASGPVFRLSRTCASTHPRLRAYLPGGTPHDSTLDHAGGRACDRTDRTQATAAGAAPSAADQQGAETARPSDAENSLDRLRADAVGR